MLRQRREAEHDRRLARARGGRRDRPAAGAVVSLGVTGARTTIVDGLLDLVPDERVVRIGRGENDDVRR